MKNQITYTIIGIVLVILGIFAFNYVNKPEIPVVGENGKISGIYTIESIMRLGEPYECTFEKIDETSKIAGIIHTDGQSIYGEFRIRTDLIEKNFSSFLVIKDNESFVWTSLQNVGYKSAVAKSATKNASAQEQAQIIGTRDKINYECKPWQNVDITIFETPSWINFVNLK